MWMRELYSLGYVITCGPASNRAVIEVEFSGFKSIGKRYKQDVLSRLVYSVYPMIELSCLTGVQLSGGSLCL